MDKKNKRPKPSREELIAICRRIYDVCKQYDPAIICEVVPMMKDIEDSVRIEAEEAGYEFVGKPNLGFVHVFITIPNRIGEKGHELLEKISQFDEVARAFRNYNRKGYDVRIKGSVRSDDADVRQ